MIGFLFVIISTLGFSLNQIFNKKLLLNNLTSVEALLFSNFFLTILSFLTMILFGKIHFSSLSIFNIALLFLAGFFGFIGILSLMKSFSDFFIGESLAIVNTYPFLILFLSYFFLGAEIKLIQFITMIFVFLGIFLLITEKNNFKISKKIFFPILTSFSWGIYGFIIFFLLTKLNLYFIIFSIEFICFILNLVYFFYTNHHKNINYFSKRGKLLFSKSNFFYGFLSGIFTLLGVLFYGLSSKYINPGIVSSINSSQLVLVFLFSYIFFDEKINKKQIFAILLIFLCLFVFYLL